MNGINERTGVYEMKMNQDDTVDVRYEFLVVFMVRHEGKQWRYKVKQGNEIIDKAEIKH